MPDKVSTPTLILFAKAPVAGQAKTRLIPELGPQAAANIAARLIQLTVDLAIDSWAGRIELKTWPDCSHPVFDHVTRKHGLETSVQCAGDLGEKMLSALRRYTDTNHAAAIMGCDVPHCPKKYLHDAYTMLADGLTNVIGPSADGGYYLIGLQHTCPDLFNDTDWGGRAVLDTTLRRGRASSVEFRQLPVLRDIDCFEDLVNVSEQNPHLELLKGLN